VKAEAFFSTFFTAINAEKRRVSGLRIWERSISGTSKGFRDPIVLHRWTLIKKIQESFSGEPLDKEEYHRLVEQVAGICNCGGKFTFLSKSRCPKCHSSDYTQDPDGTHEMFYD
jgi:hypothetical protein